MTPTELDPAEVVAEKIFDCISRSLGASVGGLYPAKKHEWQSLINRMTKTTRDAYAEQTAELERFREASKMYHG